MAETVTTYISRDYSDLDLNFNIHPVKKDINKHIAEKAIVYSIRNLIFTSIYEKPFLPEFGSNIKRLLFEPLNFVTASLIEREITEVITNFEPRVQLVSVSAQADPDNNAFSVVIQFNILNNNLPVTVQLLLERKR